jgi:hypothetical protein
VLNALAFGQMVATRSRVLGKKFDCRDVAGSGSRDLFIKVGLSPYVTDGLVETMRPLRAGRFAHTTANVTKVLDRPSRSFEFR